MIALVPDTVYIFFISLVPDTVRAILMLIRVL